MSNQIGLPGIGQQKITLSMWKSENKIFTHCEAEQNADCDRYTCWDEIKDPVEFGHEHGFDCMGFGNTEKEAILDYCKKEQIKPPFWW